MYRPGPHGFWLTSDWDELDRKLREGDSLLWPGDPRLWLGIGIIKKGKKVVGHRLEVHRDCEDGATRLIGTWHPSEAYRLLMDLGEMRLEAPGHRDAITAVDAANDKLEQAKADEYTGVMTEAMEYALRLHHDRTEPRNTFRGMPGRRDEKPET